MNTNSNSYIILYSSAMVVIVASILSFAAMELQPLQEKNQNLEKKQSILRAINIDTTRDAADELYNRYISNTIVIDNEGNEKEGLNAFDIDIAEELDKSPESRNFPLYIYEHEGRKTIIIPVRGKGLWGPIWGYVSVEDDFNTIYGATFSHDSETPGLGAEIATKKFQNQFIGKKLFNEEGEFVSVEVKKGEADPQASHEVDGISGGTITSNGVEDMLKDNIKYYLPYFNEHKKNNKSS